MQEIIDRYQLQPHPEGGYFREIYRSEQDVISPINGEKRSALTHIYFLLLKGQVSRFHRVLHDEVWNVYEGAPLRLIESDLQKVKEVEIGSGCQDYTYIFPGGLWQAAESSGDYTLVGCSVAPGFDFADFSFLDEKESKLVEDNFADYKRFV